MRNPAQWWHVARGFAAIGLMFGTTACGPGVETEEDKHEAALLEIRATYDAYLRRQPPDYVVITVPESIASLSDHARDVFQVIRSVLTNRNISHETRKLEDVLTTCVTRIRNVEYSAYKMPMAMAERGDGATVLYINLCMAETPETKRHPDAVERDITVRVWNDPSTGAKAQRPVL